MKKVKGVFCFKVKSKDKEGTWIVDLKNGSGSVKFDPQGMSLFLLHMSINDVLCSCGEWLLHFA